MQRAIDSSTSGPWLTRTYRTLDPNHKTAAIAYFFVFVLVVAGGLLAPGFTRPASLLQQLILASILGVICIGQMFVIITGNIDLSVSWTMNLCTVILTSISLGKNSNVVQAVALSLAVAVAIGLFNGLAVAYLRLPAMVMTLGVNAMLKGLTLVVTGAQPKGSPPEMFRWLVSGRIVGIPVCVIVWLCLGAITIFILQRTVFGRGVYATGNNQVASYLSGIRIEKTIVLAFVISSVCNALAGILFLSYSGQVYLSLGEPYQMPAIAAVVIGGVSIMGGSGGFVGVIAGVLIVTLLQNVLSLAHVAYAGQLIIYGLAILAMLFIYGRSAEERD